MTHRGPEKERSGPDQGRAMSGGATEWEDLLIQHGVIQAPPKPEDNTPEVVYDVTDKKESFSDSLDELDDDNFFDQYRQQRMAQLKTQSVAPRFGSVNEISRPDFLTEVTEASRTHFVVVHLFQSGLVPCQLVSRALRDLAIRHPLIKFVEIVSTRCIEKYPEHLLPTILVYRETNVYSQITVATPEKLRQTLDVIQQHLDDQSQNDN